MKNNSCRFLQCIALTIALSFYACSSFAVDRIWTGSGTDGNFSNPNNWNPTGTPASTDTIIFPDGGAQRNVTNDISGGVTVTNIMFTGGGYVISGNSITNIGVGAAGIHSFFTNTTGLNVIKCDLYTGSGVNEKYFYVLAGSELQLQGVTTNLAVNGTSPIGWLNLVGGGTVRILNGARSLRGIDLFQGTVIVDGADAVLDAAGGDPYRLRASDAVNYPALIVITNGGTMRASGNIQMGMTNQFLPTGGGAIPGATNRIDIDSGTLELYGASSSLLMGIVAGSFAVANQNGGLVWGSGGVNNVTLGNGASANGTYNLNGGTLWVGQVRQGNASATSAIFNFNGGTLKPTAGSAAFMQGLQTASVLSGGAIIDTTNFNITIAQNLADGGGGGGLTKLGSAALTLSGVDSYTGPTIVSNGTLAVNTSSLNGGGAIMVADGAALSVSDASVSLSTPSLTLGSATTLAFNLPNGTPAATPIIATSLTANGDVTVNITGGNFVPGTFPLIQFSSVTGLGNFHLGSLPGGVTASLVTDATSVSLNITSAVDALEWNGAANNQWDTTSVNWFDMNDGFNSTTYAQSGGFGDAVTFDDNGSANPAVDITLAVTPVSMTVSGDNVNYSFSGTGKISGGGTLTKTGFSTLTLDNANDFTGGTLLGGGTISLGNDAALGLGRVTITNGVLASDSATARTLANDLTLGANTGITLGNFINTGTLTLAGTIDLSGANSRTLSLDSDVVLTGVITNGGFSAKVGLGNFIIKGQIAEKGQMTQQQGDIIIDGGQLNNSGVGWRMANETPNPGTLLRLAITNGGSLLMTNLASGGNLRLGQSGEDLSSPYLLDIGGTVSIIAYNNGNDVGRLYLGGAGGKATAYLRSGGVLTCNQIAPGGTAESEFDFDGGTLIPAFSRTDFLQGLTSALVMNGGATIDTAGQDITIAQSLLASGSGGLTKIGDGALTLTGANTYSGLTAVNAGKLILGSAQAATGNLTVAASATLAFLSTSNGTPAVPNVTMTAGSVLEAQFQDTSGGNPTSVAGSINNLVLNGAVAVNLVATNISTGQFPLLSYNTISGSGSLVASQLPAGVTGTILTNTANKTIDLLVSPSVSTNAVTLTNLISGGNLNLSWPTDHTGWRLEVQTNSLTTGLSTNWFTWLGSTNVNAVSIPIAATNPSVFFRLVYP